MTSIDPRCWRRSSRCSRRRRATGSTTARSDRTRASSADLGLESLEIVVLSTMVQQQYGKLPFPQFFEEIGQRPVEERDLTVAELALFVCEHRQPSQLEV